MAGGCCIRCGEAPAVDATGYCGHCHWAVRAELEQGMRDLCRYLVGWARYRDWCDERGGEAEAAARATLRYEPDLGGS